ncbi:MAG: sodium:proton antiporter [Anaerolineae bacterium]|nr:sodium:proton antiporter [Anaerolineae bacterium]
MLPTELALFFLLVVLYSIIAVRLDRISITMPLVFVIISAIIGPYMLGWIQFPNNTSGAESLTEITLALLLFADASTLNFSKVRENAKLPARLLLIGLPLTIMLGALIAFILFPHKGIGFALLIGAILAPTDAALGLPIFNNPRVPVRIRTALNVESGLNDGIVSPLVALFIALTIAEEGSAPQADWLMAALMQIGVAVVAGIVIGLVGGFLFRKAAQNHWTSKTALQIGNLALALTCYFVSLMLGGNGFIAAFIGGLFFGYATRRKLEKATEFTESGGTLLSLFVWALFGANVLIPLFQNFNATTFLFAILALTVMRMVPVAIALRGTHLRTDTVLMMGWLGPRGLASVVFMLLAFESLAEAHLETRLLVSMAGWTIFLSVVLHALSAVPLAAWYARRLETASPDAPELEAVSEILTRHKSMVHSGKT